MRTAGLDFRSWTSGPTGVGMGETVSPSRVPAGWSVVQGWEVEQGSCFWGSSWGPFIPERSSSDGRAPFARYPLPLRPRLAGLTLGLHHLTLPHPNTNPAQKDRRQAEKAGLRVFISMPEPAQTWQTTVPEGKEGRQWQTEPGPVPGRQPGPG